MFVFGLYFLVFFGSFLGWFLGCFLSWFMIYFYCFFVLDFDLFLMFFVSGSDKKNNQNVILLFFCFVYFVVSFPHSFTR